MALDKDEFDIELESTFFDIEPENDDLYKPVQPVPVQTVTYDEPEGDNEAVSNQTPKLIEVRPLVITEESANASIPRAQNLEPDENHEFDLDMDDGYDDIFSQIDENKINTVSTGPAFPSHRPQDDDINNKNKNPTHGCGGPNISKKIIHNSENSPLKRNATCETSPFFSSQNINASAAPPVKRRFPGPAGLLPHQRSEENISIPSQPAMRKISKAKSSENLLNLSFSSTSPIAYRKVTNPARPPKGRGNSNDILLSKAPWKALTETLGLNQKDNDDLLNILNIKWVRTKGRGCSGMMKIPFLAVVVQTKMEVASYKKKLRYKNPGVRLMDPSGAITAAFSSQFVEAFGDKVVPGAALALRNCGVMGIGVEKQVIVTVPKKSLLCMATTAEITDEEKISICESDPMRIKFKTENGVSVIQTGPFQRGEILEEFSKLANTLSAARENFRKTSLSMPSENSNRNTLFSTVSTSSTNTLETGPGNSRSFSPMISNHQSVPIPSPNVNSTDTFGFDDDDDDELMLALENIDFVIDEDSM